MVSGDFATQLVSALTLSKATHEFLVLHYFALDSAKYWDEVLEHVLPMVGLPGAQVRRATALQVFRVSQIPPSHRRMPHGLIL